MSTLAAAPLIVPLLAVVVCLLCWRVPTLQRWTSILSSVVLTILGLALMEGTADGTVIVLQVSAWVAPFGITLAVDQLSAFFALGTGAVSLVALLYGFSDVSPEIEKRGFYPLFNALLLGVNGAFCTGDLFNMYVWFEVLLMSSFVLMTIEGTKKQLRAGITYVLINLLSSTCFLVALGLLYAQLGTLTIAHLTARVADLAGSGQAAPLIPVGMLLCMAFSIKAALFPFFFWLPGTYPTPMPAITALFAGLLTKVGVYALLRVFGMVFAPLSGHFSGLLFWMALLSMLAGSLGALAAGTARRALAFSIVSGVGLTTIGIALGTAESLGASIFYSFQSMLVTAGLFLLVGAIRASSGTDELRAENSPSSADSAGAGGGLFVGSPLLAGLFLLSALSLAGIPPLPGFIGKVMVLRGAVTGGASFSVAVVVVSGMISLMAIATLWAELCWKQPPQARRLLPIGRARTASIVVGAAALVAVLIFSSELVNRATRAGGSLLNPERYIAAVLPFGVPSVVPSDLPENTVPGRLYVHKE